MTLYVISEVLWASFVFSLKVPGHPPCFLVPSVQYKGLHSPKKLKSLTWAEQTCTHSLIG